MHSPVPSVSALAIGKGAEPLGTPMILQPTSRRGELSTVSPFALAAALLFASLLGWSGRALARPPKAFTSGLPAIRSPLRLPDITTAPHWDLRRRDSHPQVQRLASLRAPKAPSAQPAVPARPSAGLLRPSLHEQDVSLEIARPFPGRFRE